MSEEREDTEIYTPIESMPGLTKTKLEHLGIPIYLSDIGHFAAQLPVSGTMVTGASLGTLKAELEKAVETAAKAQVSKRKLFPVFMLNAEAGYRAKEYLMSFNDGKGMAVTITDARSKGGGFFYKDDHGASQSTEGSVMRFVEQGSWLPAAIMEAKRNCARLQLAANAWDALEARLMSMVPKVRVPQFNSVDARDAGRKDLHAAIEKGLVEATTLKPVMLNGTALPKVSATSLQLGMRVAVDNVEYRVKCIRPEWATGGASNDRKATLLGPCEPGSVVRHAELILTQPAPGDNSLSPEGWQEQVDSYVSEFERDSDLPIPKVSADAVDIGFISAGPKLIKL